MSFIKFHFVAGSRTNFFKSAVMLVAPAYHSLLSSTLFQTSRKYITMSNVPLADPKLFLASSMFLSF